MGVGTLGRGSMGIVYRAQDPEIGRQVAIKTLRKLSSPALQDMNAARDRFKLEARSAGILRHPNIITIFEVSIEGDTPYIVMDYVEGESLDIVLNKSGRLDGSLVIRYLSQIADGLDYAHSKGVIHRDIKPSNILIDPNGTAFLLDFGIASISETLNQGAATPGKPAPVMGSPGYMSPEQILGHQLDNRTDLFSLGVVAFECVAGKRPFPGDNFTAVISKILSGKPLALTSIVPELPLALESEFEKVLNRQADKRYSGARETVAALANAMGLDMPAGPAGSHALAPRRRKVSVWKSFARHDSEPLPVIEPPQQAIPHPWGPDQGRAWLPPRGAAGPASHHSGVARGPGQMFKEIPGVTRPYDDASSSSKAKLITRIFVGLSLVMVGTISLLMFGHSPNTEQVSLAASSPANTSAVEPIAEIIVDPDFVSKYTESPPIGKVVEEMSDRQVVGVLLSKESTDAMLISALHEGLSRKLPHFVEGALIPLQSDSYAVRIEAIKTLSQLGDIRVVPKLVLSLDDYDPLVRGHAAKAIGELGSRAALGYLSARLAKEDASHVKVLIKKAIDKINGFPSKE